MNAEKTKSLLQYIGFTLCFLGIFIFPYSVRTQFFSQFTQKTYIWAINYLAWAGFFLLVLSKAISMNKLNIIFIGLTTIAFLLSLYTFSLTSRDYGFAIVYASCCIFPLNFIILELSPSVRNTILRYFLLVFNIVICLMLLWAVIDRILDYPISRWIATFMTYDGNFYTYAYPTDQYTKRFYSFFDGPLFNAFLFNGFYVLNIAYNEHHKPLIPSLICTILSFLAIACCGSKTGFFVVIAITLIVYYRNFKLLIYAGITMVILIFSGLMDNLIGRLLNGSLTTGRFTTLFNLLTDKNFSFPFLHGYGPYSAIMSSYHIATFELSFFCSAIIFGLVYAGILLIIPLIYISSHLCRKGAFHVWLLWGLLFAELNSFNSIIVERDYLIISCFIFMILLNIHYDNNIIINAQNVSSCNTDSSD